MKKTYIRPSMDIVKIETQQVIAASAGFGSGTKDGSGAAAPEFNDFDFNPELPDIPPFVFE